MKEVSLLNYFTVGEFMSFYKEMMENKELSYYVENGVIYATEK